MEYIIAVIIGVFVASQPIVKGFIGDVVTWITMRGLNNKEYTIFNHVNITKKDGTIGKIDQVIVSKYGIFVLKKMDMSGSIFGDELMKEWGQVKFGKNKKFTNPIIENKGNVKSLIANLGEYKGKFISIISFSNKGILKKMVTKRTPVVLSIWVAREIKRYDKILLSDVEIERVNKRLAEMI